MDEQTPQIPIQHQAIPPVEDVSTAKSKLPVIIGGIVLLILIGAGSYYLGRQSNKVAIQTSPTPTTVPTNPSPTPVSNAANADPTTNLKTFNETQGRFQFQYNPNWTVFTEFPDKNFPPQSEVSCRGVILINNIDTKNQNIIMVDFDRKGSDGSWCFSAGTWEKIKERRIKGSASQYL